MFITFFKVGGVAVAEHPSPFNVQIVAKRSCWMKWCHITRSCNLLCILLNSCGEVRSSPSIDKGTSPRISLFDIVVKPLP